MFKLLSLVFGHAVSLDEINDRLALLAARWRDSCVLLPSGDVGWYRILNVTDRVGVVATANAIFSLASSRADVSNCRAIVESLLSRRLENGSWAFVSGVSDRGVIDSTSAVVIALQLIRDDPQCRDLNVNAAIQTALDWLESSVNSDGGWGLIANGSYRAYSTSLAVQALCFCGRKTSNHVQRATKKLLSTVDAVSGGWFDMAGKLSIPNTAEAILALNAASRAQLSFSIEIGRAQQWLMSIAKPTNFWTDGIYARPVEEVNVTLDQQLVRIEHGNSPRPMVIKALCLGKYRYSSEVLLSVRRLLDDISHDQWAAATGSKNHDLTSWILYDVTYALTEYRALFSNRVDMLWTNHSRVVEHFQGEGSLKRNVKRHFVKYVFAIAVVFLAVALHKMGLLKPDLTPLTLLLAGIGAVATHMLAELVSAFIWARRTNHTADRGH